MTRVRRIGLGRALLVSTLVVANLAGPVPMGSAHAAAGTQVIDIVQVDGLIDSAYADFIVDEIVLANRKHFAAIVLRIDSAGVVKADARRVVEAVAASPVAVTTWVGPNGAQVRGRAFDIWAAGDVRFAGPRARGIPTTDVSGVKATIGEVVRSIDGVDEQTAKIRFANPGLVRRVRHTLVLPWLAYLLLVGGLGALVFELFQRGFGPAGYAGLVALAAAGVGLAGLPTNPLMLALLVAGVAAMALDVARGGLGVPTWGGAALLAAGSAYLVHAGTPAGRVPALPLAVGVGGSVLFYVVVMTVVLRAVHALPGAGAAALVGRVAEVRSTLNPQGHVLVDGALWRARALDADGAVATGVKVEVTAVDETALLLDVVPVSPED
ncbi:MAG: NfeD family protein [Mycobacteriales bacterium]|nr:hypothetical protein [Frankia sp.]